MCLKHLIIPVLCSVILLYYRVLFVLRGLNHCLTEHYACCLMFLVNVDVVSDLHRYYLISSIVGLAPLLRHLSFFS